MAYASARPITVKLTDANADPVIAAPDSTQQIIVYSIVVAHDDDVANTISVFEDNGGAQGFTFVLPAAGGSDSADLQQGWGLPPGTALKAQQSGDLNAYVSVLYRIAKVP